MILVDFWENVLLKTVMYLRINVPTFVASRLRLVHEYALPDYITKQEDLGYQ